MKQEIIKKSSKIDVLFCKQWELRSCKYLRRSSIAARQLFFCQKTQNRKAKNSLGAVVHKCTITYAYLL